MALKEKYKGQIEFIVVDVDNQDAQKLAAEYQVDAIPTFRFINGAGEVVASQTGEISQSQFEKYIGSILDN